MGALSKMRTSAAWILRAVLLYFAVKFVRARRVWVQGLRHIESMDFPTATFKSFLSKTMLGNIPEQARNLNRVYDFRLDLFSEYGSSFFWVSPIWNPHPTLSTTDPAIVKHILKDNFENYLKSDMLVKRLGDLLGSGIFGINHGVRKPKVYEKFLPFELKKLVASRRGPREAVVFSKKNRLVTSL